MRISFRETKNDPDLMQRILTDIAGDGKVWYLNATRILATMLIVQRDHPASVKEVCERYEAAITALRRPPDGGTEAEIFQILDRETYPGILYVDREIVWENMTITKFLENSEWGKRPTGPPEGELRLT